MTCQLEKWGHITSVGMVGVWFGCMTFYGGAYAKCFYFNIYIYSFYSFLCFLHVMLNIFFFWLFFLHYIFFFLAAPCATCIQYGLLLYAWKNKTKTRRLLLPLYLWVFFNICLFLFKHFISFLKYKNLKLRLRKNIQTNKKQKKKLKFCWRKPKARLRHFVSSLFS